MSDCQTTSYRHREAFALMQYESADGNFGRLIWNSRDGVTPFVVTIEGVECKHVRWFEDICAPSFNPPDDHLVFVDDFVSADRWREIFRRRVEGYPQAAPPEGPERDEFIEHLVRTQMAESGEQPVPGLVTAAEWRRRESRQR